MRSHREKEKLFSSCINQKALSKKKGKTRRREEEKITWEMFELVFLRDWVWCVEDICWTWTCGAHIDGAEIFFFFFCESFSMKFLSFSKVYQLELPFDTNHEDDFIEIRSNHNRKKLWSFFVQFLVNYIGNSGFLPSLILELLKKILIFFSIFLSKIIFASLLNLVHLFSFCWTGQKEKLREREDVHVLRMRTVYFV